MSKHFPSVYSSWFNTSFPSQRPINQIRTEISLTKISKGIRSFFIYFFKTLYTVERVRLRDQEAWKTNGRRHSERFKISRATEKGNLSSFVITNAWSMMQAGFFQAVFYSSVKLIGTRVLSGICSEETHFFCVALFSPQLTGAQDWCLKPCRAQRLITFT